MCPLSVAERGGGGGGEASASASIFTAILNPGKARALEVSRKHLCMNMGFTVLEYHHLCRNMGFVPCSRHTYM
jgi:hypothetical protein